jgi:hypothetical protein
VIRSMAVALALAGLLGGCGWGKGNASASSSPRPEDQAMKFAQCMRQHGVNVADPKPGEPGVRITGQRLDDSKIKAASEACRKYSPRGNLNPNDPKVRDNMLKMAQCLRRHGVNIADPQAGQGLQIKIKKGDTKTQQAAETCRREVPPPSASPTNGG